MAIRWKLRMTAAQREVWTAAELQRLLRERAGLEMSMPSVWTLLTKQPRQVKLETLAALCQALECTPNELFEINTVAVAAPAAKPAGRSTAARSRSTTARSLPPA
jgi:putative transcriptional regulator